MAPNVVVVGGISLDSFALVGAPVQPNASLLAEELYEGPGGKGANQAVAAARLGAQVELVGRVGDDAGGERLLEHLRSEGVGLSHVSCDRRQGTGRSLGIVQRGASEVSAGWLGANERLSVESVAAARPVIEDADVLLCQFEVPARTVRAAVDLAGRTQALVVIDPAPPGSAAAEIASVADAVMLNATEARQLTGVEPDDEISALHAAHRLLAAQPRFAAVSAGAAGDLLAWDDQHAWARAPKVNVVDPTGGGDALHAALAVRLVAGDPPAQALRFASAASALAMTRLGAQAALPRPADVARLLAEEASPGLRPG